MKKYAALSALLLAGCATWGQFDEGLNDLIGQPIDVAINKMGYPAGERQIAGRRLVVWGRNTSGLAYMPTSSTTYGTVNAGQNYGSYSQTTSGGYMMPVSYSCNVTLEVDANNIIRRYQYDGNLGGCEGYIKAVKRK